MKQVVIDGEHLTLAEIKSVAAGEAQVQLAATARERSG